MSILTETQKKAIHLLAQSSLKDKFYWTGGTLLAYHYLHHRRSLDLDFFSEKPFSLEEVDSFVKQIKKGLDFREVSYQKIFDRWEFLFENKEVLRIEFVYYNKEKKTLGKRRKLLGVYIDSLDDIAANKVMAYFDRNEPKDLFDIYFLIKKGKFTSQELLKLVQQKFSVKFSEDLFWGESFKGLSRLFSLKPLMMEKSKEGKDKLLAEIEEYFKEKSKKYLNIILQE